MAFKVPTAIVTGVVVLSGLAIGSAIDKSLPSTDDLLSEPFKHEAAVGETVSMRTADLAVTRVRTTKSLALELDTMKTDYVFVVLDLSFTAKGEAGKPSEITYRSVSGEEYASPYELWANCRTAQAGVPQNCQVAMEVDPEDLPGMTVEIAASKNGFTSGDALAVIDLGIGADSDLITAPEPSLTVEPVSYANGGN